MISINDIKGSSLEGEFSIKIVKKNLFDSKTPDLFQDDLNLFFGKSDKISIDRSKADWLESLDNFLILNPEKIPWYKILNGNLLTPQYSATNIVQRTGSVYFLDNKNLRLDSADIFFYTQKSKLKYATKLQKNKVWLPLPTLFWTGWNYFI